jgi:hypothetical protein
MHYEVVEPSAIYEYIDGEVLALNLQTGIYVQMKQLSAELFYAVATGRSAEMVSHAARNAGYSEAQITDFDMCYSNWVSLGLLQVARNAQHPDTEPLSLIPGLQFSEESWDDLSELIMMDPVHDVSPQGWPSRVDE